MQGFEVSVREKGKIWRTAVIWAVMVYAVLASIFYAYFSVFQVEINFYHVALAIGLTIPLPLILLWKKKYFIRKVICVAAVFAVFAVLFREKIYAGAVPYINKYIALYNSYHKQTLLTLIAETDLISKILVLFLIGTLFSFILLIVLELKKGLLFSVFIIFIPVILAAFVGKMPTDISCWGLLAAGCFYVILYHDSVERWPIKAWAGAACVLLILFSISSVIQPMITEYKMVNRDKYDEIKEKISEDQRSVFSKWDNKLAEIKNKENSFGGGVSKGDLTGVTSFNPTGEEAMEIIVDERPQDTVYLKAFVGSKYTGEKWEEISSFKLSEVISILGGANDRRALLNEPFRRINEGTEDFGVNHMKITLSGASREFGYAPYFAEITSEHNVHLDSYVEGGWSNKREYDLYLESSLYWPYNEYYESTMGNSLAEASDLWIKYQEFVKETYVGDYEELELLNDYCDEINKDELYFIESAISILSIDYKYSRNPGEMPEDMDFIEGFFFETKRGFCVHFASTATVIYQICGVPARYVEGYAVSPDQFMRQKDGTYKAIVTDEAAHAWCEIFNEEVGWQVKEYTPAAGGNSLSDDIDDYRENDSYEQNNDNQEDLNDDTAQTEDNPPEENQQEDQPEKDSNSEENPQENQDDLDGIGVSGQAAGKEKEVLLNCATVAGMIMILLFVVVFQKKIRRKRKIRSFGQKKDNRGILKIYSEIHNLCAFAGFTVSNQQTSDESEKEKVKKMAEMFSQLSEEEWNWIYDLAEKAAFSGQVFSTEEQKELYHLYKRLRREILKELKWRRKIWFLYGKVL